MRAGMKVKFAAPGRFDTRWLVHDSMKDMSWLRDHRGKTYQLKGAAFAIEHTYLGDTQSWSTIQSGVA